MRTLLAAALLFGLTACSKADDKKKEPAKKDEPRLKVGDPAPPLKVGTWLNGPAVAQFAPGKVYVLDFWATWCGPCIQMMPHLAELQHEYHDAGLVVLPVTTTDERNTAAAVAGFVTKRGKKLGLTFAVCDTEDADKAYMEAAGQTALPTSFVVDKQGKVAFVGHPMELDDVLPKVLAGTWRGQPDLDAINKETEELEAIWEKGETKPTDALKTLAGFEAAHADKAKRPLFQVRKLVLLLQAKRFDDAKALTDALLPALAEKKNAGMLANLQAVWSSPEVNPDRKHMNLAVAAADAVLKVEGETDPAALSSAAEAYYVAGDKEKAAALGKKAAAHAPDAESKAYFDKQLKRYEK